LLRSRGRTAAVASETSRNRKSPSREKLKKNRADAPEAADLDWLAARLYSSRPSLSGRKKERTVGSVIKKRRKKMRKHKKKKLLKRSRHKRK